MNLSIPDTWQTTKLSELAIFVLGGDWGKDADFESPDYATALCIRGAEFRNWNEDKGSTASPRKIKKSSLANRVLKDGDILVEISGGGPDQPVGRTVLIDKVALSHAPELPKICTNFVRLLRTTNEIDSRFLNSYLTFFYASGEIRDYQAGSNNLRNLKFNDYLGIDIPIPPLNEQHRIVAKIEELFSELDKGIENLKTAQAQLKVYRQALLKHAFEGKLTVQWREQNRGKLETAAALQQRIQQERAQRYQQQLADWEAGGKQGGKPKAPKPLPPLTGEELAELPVLPEGWIWVSVAQLLSDGLCNGKSVKDRIGGFPVLRLNALGDGKIDLSVSKAGDWNETEALNYIVQNGDFLVSRGNGSKHLVGRGGFVHYKGEHAQPVAFPDTMIRIRLLRGVLNMPYFGYCWDSILLRSQIEKSARTTAGIYKINQELIEAFVLPLPSLDEQCVISDMLGEKLSVEQLDQTLTTSLQQAEALRQSILKRAFAGALVAQDPHDEPASMLLARIKAERDGAITKTRRKAT